MKKTIPSTISAGRVSDRKTIFKRKTCLILGVSLLLISLILLVHINAPTSKEETFRFSSTYNDRTATLDASYFETPGAEYGVLICTGFSCDREKLRPMADLFAANGASVMMFDYSGQGASGSTIGFDNAKTNHISTEINDAIKVFHEKSGIAYDHMAVVGHSLGGRSILRLFTLDMYDENRVGAAFLYAPDVDYEFSVQASLFTGASDNTEEPWVSYSGAHTKGMNIYLYNSTGDDTVNYMSTEEMYRRLGGSVSGEPGPILPSVSVTNEFGSKITLGVTTGVLHSYQNYSYKFARFMNEAFEDFTGIKAVYNPYNFLLLYAAWFLGIAGLYFLLKGLTYGYSGTISRSTDQILTLLSIKPYLRRKLLLWIPALLLMGVICSISVVMPFGTPVLNIVYMGSIAGYGMTMLFCYRKGHFKGTEGKLPKLSFRISEKCLKAKGTDGLLATIVIVLLICAYVWYALFVGMYRLYPMNWRLFWLAFATLMMTIGYYVSGCENDMLQKAGVPLRYRILYNLIQYVPLFLYSASYIALGSWSGLVEQATNVTLMYIFAIPLGRYVRMKTGNRLYGAIVTAFVFQSFMINSSALIAIFR